MVNKMQQAKVFAATSCGPGSIGAFAKAKSLSSQCWLMLILIVISLIGIDCELNKNCKYLFFFWITQNFCKDAQDKMIIFFLYIFPKSHPKQIIYKHCVKMHSPKRFIVKSTVHWCGRKMNEISIVSPHFKRIRFYSILCCALICCN